MNAMPLRMHIAALAMLLAAGLAVVMKPTQRIADAAPRIDLESMIPARFGDWRIDPTIVPITVAPDVQAKLDKIYNQTLSRTYVNGSGQRIMLSIAYGGDQSGESTQVHRPEFCYTSQGFNVVRSAVAEMATRFGSLSVRRLVAVQGRRNEPITYWITVGDRATLPGIGRKLSQLTYGLTGKVPDGMLVRVSSIEADAGRAYALQESFVQDLLASVDPATRVRLVGVMEG